MKIHLLLLVLAWASLVLNMILLLYISIDGNKAKRMQKILNACQTVLGRERANMEALEKFNHAQERAHKSIMDKVIAISEMQEGELTGMRNHIANLQKGLLRKTEYIAELEKVITDNGWELGTST
jgi:hypothetical protein